MKNEKKFRLIKDNKIVGYEYHMRCSGGIQIEYSYDNHWGNPIAYIVHDDKQHFIGLKDKNDKEIYEGDIMREKYGYDNIPYSYYVVKFGMHDGGRYGFYLDNYGALTDIETFNKLEVIGNICDNPELVK